MQRRWAGRARAPGPPSAHTLQSSCRRASARPTDRAHQRARVRRASARPSACAPTRLPRQRASAREPGVSPSLPTHLILPSAMRDGHSRPRRMLSAGGGVRFPSRWHRDWRERIAAGDTRGHAAQEAGDSHGASRGPSVRPRTSRPAGSRASPRASPRARGLRCRACRRGGRSRAAGPAPSGRRLRARPGCRRRRRR